MTSFALSLVGRPLGFSWLESHQQLCWQLRLAGKRERGAVEKPKGSLSVRRSAGLVGVTIEQTH